MSFTTRCPSCGTVFRVVADQLKISDGWVRCGHCSDVFDATIDLDAWLPPGPAPVVATPPAAADAEPPGAVAQGAARPAQDPAAEAGPPRPASPAADPPTDDDLHAWFGEGPLDAPGARASEPAAPPPEADAGEVPEAQDGFEPLAPEAEPQPEPPRPDTDPLDVPSVSSMLTMASHDGDAEDGPAQAPESEFHAELERFAHSTRAPLADPGAAAADAAPAGEPEPLGVAPAKDADKGADQAPHEAAAEAEPGFVRQARRQAFWSSPGTRITLSLLAVVLALLLAGQWAYHARHSVVAAQPALKPWVERACGWLGCDLAPVRRLDAIVIESAELVRRLGNFYSFDIVLRNQSALEVALPALELALTDSGENVVARRIFLPRDWPDAATALPPDGRVSVSFRLSISLGEGVPTAGYRALVFYP